MKTTQFVLHFGIVLARLPLGGNKERVDIISLPSVEVEEGGSCDW